MKSALALPDLAIEINEALVQAAAAYAEGLERFDEGLKAQRLAGERLLQAKAAVRHGEWLPWIEANVGATKERSCQRCMQIASNWPEISRKWAEFKVTAGDVPLSLTSALAMIAAPEEPTRVEVEVLPSQVCWGDTPPSNFASEADEATSTQNSKLKTQNSDAPKFRVTSDNNIYHGQVVEQVEVLNKGDIVLCRTGGGVEFPFVAGELGPVDTEVSRPKSDTHVAFEQGGSAQGTSPADTPQKREVLVGIARSLSPELLDRAIELLNGLRREP